MWSYFEDLVIRKLIIQFKFNLDTRFKIYSFFSSKFFCMWDDISSFVFFACMHRLFSILNDCSGSNLHRDYWTGSLLTKREKYFFGWWMSDHHLRWCITAPLLPPSLLPLFWIEFPDSCVFLRFSIQEHNTLFHFIAKQYAKKN